MGKEASKHRHQMNQCGKLSAGIKLRRDRTKRGLRQRDCGGQELEQEGLWQSFDAHLFSISHPVSEHGTYLLVEDGQEWRKQERG